MQKRSSCTTLRTAKCGVQGAEDAGRLLILTPEMGNRFLLAVELPRIAVSQVLGTQ